MGWVKGFEGQSKTGRLRGPQVFLCERKSGILERVRISCEEEKRTTSNS